MFLFIYIYLFCSLRCCQFPFLGRHSMLRIFEGTKDFRFLISFFHLGFAVTYSCSKFDYFCHIQVLIKHARDRTDRKSGNNILLTPYSHKF